MAFFPRKSLNVPRSLPLSWVCHAQHASWRHCSPLEVVYSALSGGAAWGQCPVAPCSVSEPSGPVLVSSGSKHPRKDVYQNSFFGSKNHFPALKEKEKKRERGKKKNAYHCFPWELEAETELTCGLYWGGKYYKAYEYRDSIWELIVTAMFLLAFLPNTTLIAYMVFSTRFPQFSRFPEYSFNGSAYRVLSAKVFLCHSDGHLCPPSVSFYVYFISKSESMLNCSQS